MPVCSKCSGHAVQACGGCFDQTYCGDSCQRSDWTVHKAACNGKLVSECSLCEGTVTSPVACPKCKSVVYCSRDCRSNDAVHKEHICSAVTGIGSMIGAPNKESVRDFIAMESAADKLVHLADLVGDDASTEPERATARSWISSLWSYLHDMMRTMTKAMRTITWTTLVQGGSIPGIAAVTDALSRLSVAGDHPSASLLASVINQLVPVYDWMAQLLSLDGSPQDEDYETTITAITGSRNEVSALRRIFDSVGSMATRVVRFMVDALYSAFKMLSTVVFEAGAKTAEFVGSMVGWSLRFFDKSSSVYKRMAQFSLFVQYMPVLQMKMLPHMAETMQEIMQDLAGYVSNFIEDIVRPKLIPLLRDGAGRTLADGELKKNKFWGELYAGAGPVLAASIAVPVGWLWSAISSAALVTYGLMSSVLYGLLSGTFALFSDVIGPNFESVNDATKAPGDAEIEGSAQLLLNAEKVGSIAPLRKADRELLTKRLAMFRDLRTKAHPTLTDRISSEGGATRVVANTLRGAWKASKMFVEHMQSDRAPGTEADDVFVMQHLNGSTRGTTKQYNEVRKALLDITTKLWPEVLSKIDPKNAWMTDSSKPIVFDANDDDVTKNEAVASTLDYAQQIGAGPDGKDSTKSSSPSSSDTNIEEFLRAADAATSTSQVGNNLNPDTGALVAVGQQAAAIRLTEVARRPPSSIVRGIFIQIGPKRYYVLGHDELEAPGTIPQWQLTVIDLKRKEDREIYNREVLRMVSVTPELRGLIEAPTTSGALSAAVSAIALPILIQSIVPERGSYTKSRWNMFSWLGGLAVLFGFCYANYWHKFVDISYGFANGAFAGGTLMEKLSVDAQFIAGIYQMLSSADVRMALAELAKNAGGEKAAQIQAILSAYTLVTTQKGWIAGVPFLRNDLEAAFSTIAGSGSSLLAWFQELGYVGFEETAYFVGVGSSGEFKYTLAGFAPSHLKTLINPFVIIANKLATSSKGLVSVSLTSARESFSRVIFPESQTWLSSTMDYLNKSSFGKWMAGGVPNAAIAEFLIKVAAPFLVVMIFYQLLVEVIFYANTRDHKKEYEDAVASGTLTPTELKRLRGDMQFFSVNAIGLRAVARISTVLTVVTFAFDMRAGALMALGSTLINVGSNAYAQAAANAVIPNLGNVIGVISGGGNARVLPQPPSGVGTIKTDGPIIEEIQ